MNSTLASLFGPVDKSACSYFLMISVVFFILICVTIVSYVLFMAKNAKSINTHMVVSAVLLSFNLFIGYFTNRMFYNMCTGAGPR